MEAQRSTKPPGLAKQKRKVILITGASRGLGLATTKLLLSKDKYHIIATARESSLQRFKEAGLKEKKNFWIRQLDVLVKDDRDKLIKEIDEELGGVTVLINNAGYMLRAVVEHVGEMERFQQMNTNFRAPMALIRRVLPKMRENRGGNIINISSVGGMVAMPTMSVYSASKYALEGASESLWYEVKPWNIKVTLIQPGFINSDSYKNVKLTRESIKSIENEDDPYYRHYNSMTPFIDRLMGLSFSTPEKVAKKIYKTIERRNPRLRVPATLDAHVFYIIRRVLPRRAYHFLLYYSLPKVLRWGDKKT